MVGGVREGANGEVVEERRRTEDLTSTMPNNFPTG